MSRLQPILEANLSRDPAGIVRQYLASRARVCCCAGACGSNYYLRGTLPAGNTIFRYSRGYL